MSKHTPGPWRYERHNVDSNYMLIFCSNNKFEGDNLRGYCGESNARLIAAAPDLLGALQKMIEQFECHELNNGDVSAMNAARAAIAKATGEQT